MPVLYHCEVRGSAAAGGAGMTKCQCHDCKHNEGLKCKFDPDSQCKPETCERCSGIVCCGDYESLPGTEGE